MMRPTDQQARDIAREEFLLAIEHARAQHDPAVDWGGFREELWGYFESMLGLRDAPEGSPPLDHR